MRELAIDTSTNVDVGRRRQRLSPRSGPSGRDWSSRRCRSHDSSTRPASPCSRASVYFFSSRRSPRFWSRRHCWGGPLMVGGRGAIAARRRSAPSDNVRCSSSRTGPIPRTQRRGIRGYLIRRLSTTADGPAPLPSRHRTFRLFFGSGSVRRVTAPLRSRQGPLLLLWRFT